MTRLDVLGEELRVGDRVACAFSYSRASVGHLRLGHIEVMEDDFIQIRWEADYKLSPKMSYGMPSRWLRL